MKHTIYFFVLVVLLQGCGFREREQNITKKERELVQREADLTVREQQVVLKEQLLKDKELLLDSTRKQIDSINSYNPAIIGTWLVKMKCIETSCEGSAIGDSKTEQWEISYDSTHTVIVKAFSGKRLARVYTGYYKSGNLELNDESAIHVVLSFSDKNKMEGTREITQENCKIIYGLSADKPQ